MVRRIFWALIGLALLAGLGLHRGAASRDAALTLPLATTSAPAPAPGRLTTRTILGMPVGHAAQPVYSPSDRIAALSPEHLIWHGIIPHSWREFLPETAPPDRPAPLVVLLHGAGRNGLSQIEMWERTARKHGIALIAPDSPGGTWTPDRPAPALLIRMIEDLARRHPIDRQRIYLFGHSNGAAMAQVLLNRTAGPWRAAALHGGGASMRHMAQPGSGKPLRYYIGEHDVTAPPGPMRELAESMAALGHDTDFLLIPDHDHWFYAAGPMIADHAWAWMSGLEGAKAEGPPDATTGPGG